MNHVFVPNAQSLFVNHTQTPPTFYVNEHFMQMACGLIDFQKKLEQDKIKVYPKPTAACPYPAMNPIFVWAINQMQQLSIDTNIFNGFEVNPYLNVLQKFAVENSQLLNYPQPIHCDTLKNVFNRLRAELYTAKAKLHASKYLVEVQKFRNEQKSVFRRVMQTKEQANCIFLDLPILSCTNNFHYSIYEEIEKKSVKMVKKYLKSLHEAAQLKDILYDIHWRIIKGLDHQLSAQAFVYIIGDDMDYLPLLKEQWELVCLDYQLQGIFSMPKHTHCYDGQGITQKAWLQLIERVHEPLSFYRYKGNGITYAWKKYTGNV
ncbi:hypothetical protein [Acinetobacter sp. MD2(2019)]|uniref:hypothetical protein n=1 Tax=Acinetobacter sp. MD2(2019) TaxID=2605273 RepID=UPI002D1F7CF4|nr:hypothetical protein [Acinetobacter sp. MD2(2019)]MEB3753754.1 hypothetical protein [Acinetobacter sp. MD2(2019)]